ERDVLHAERLQAATHRFGWPAADDGDVQAGLQHHLDAEPVADVVGLDLFAVRADVELAVGQHAVDVEEQAADLPRPCAHGAGVEQVHTTPARSRSCMWITPSRCWCSSSTSSTVI